MYLKDLLDDLDDLFVPTLEEQLAFLRRNPVSPEPITTSVAPATTGIVQGLYNPIEQTIYGVPVSFYDSKPPKVQVALIDEYFRRQLNTAAQLQQTQLDANFRAKALNKIR